MDEPLRSRWVKVIGVAIPLLMLIGLPALLLFVIYVIGGSSPM